MANAPVMYHPKTGQRLRAPMATSDEFKIESVDRSDKEITITFNKVPDALFKLIQNKYVTNKSMRIDIENNTLIIDSTNLKKTHPNGLKEANFFRNISDTLEAQTMIISDPSAKEKPSVTATLYKYYITSDSIDFLVSNYAIDRANHTDLIKAALLLPLHPIKDSEANNVLSHFEQSLKNMASFKQIYTQYTDSLIFSTLTQNEKNFVAHCHELANLQMFSNLMNVRFYSPLRPSNESKEEMEAKVNYETAFTRLKNANLIPEFVEKYILPLSQSIKTANIHSDKEVPNQELSLLMQDVKINALNEIATSQNTDLESLQRILKKNNDDPENSDTPTLSF